MKKEFFNKLRKSGVVLMEMILVLAIGSTILTAVAVSLAGSQQASLQSSQNQQAELHLQEISEAVKSVKDAGWSSIADNDIYHPEVFLGDWILVENEETIGIYKRRIEIEDVFRDETGNIVVEGGTLDPSTKKITAVVGWTTPRPASVSQTFFLTRHQDNISWIEDTFDDFNDGTEDATDVTNNPGYVQLAETGGGGWTEPASLGTVDGRYKASGIWATDTHIFLTADRLFGGIEVFNIEDSPDVPSSVGYFGFTYRPNDCAAVNGYLYVTNSLPLGTINIYDISANPINPPWVAARGLFYQAGGIWATDDYLFVSGKSEEFVVVYQLSGGHYTDPDFLGWFETPEDTVDIAVSGSYLYLAQESTSNAVEIYDISANPASPSHISTLTTLYEPTGIWTESNILYLSMESKRGAMYSLAADPTSPELFGYFPTERNTADIAAYGDYGYVAGADSQLKVIEVFSLADSKGLSGIYFIYGEYISSTLDAGDQAAFNRISWEGEKSSNTDILFQVASNDDDSTWNFVGPDGTGATYFEDPGGIPLNSILGRYFKYKIILTGLEGNDTPVVDKVIVNYSS